MREGVGRLEVYPSIWGHWAGGEFWVQGVEGGRGEANVCDIGPGDSVEDTKWLDEKLREFFAEN